MKRLIPGLALLALAACTATPSSSTPGTRAPAVRQEASSGRITKVINATWTFINQDIPEAKAAEFQDQAWTATNLPHTFELPYWRTNLASTPPVGWYRKQLVIEPAWLSDGKRVFIEFEGVFLVSEVYVNGKLAGTHKGGYTGFSYDITDSVKAGRNTIAVKVDASWNPQITPRAGEHIFAGGIYRDVYLVVTAPVHVTWCGTFVTTPQATADSATVKVQTELRNDSLAPQACQVKSIVLDASGKSVATIESAATLPAGTATILEQLSPAIRNPQLWSPDTTSATPPPQALDLGKRPYLYTLRTEVRCGGKLVDSYQTPFGIRSIAWNTENGFALNGKKFWIKGANVHQDHAGWGDAICNAASYRDVKLLHDAGFNFIRGSHYPHDPAFVDACDQLGMTFWSEIPFWGIGGFNKVEDGGKWNPSAYPGKPEDQAAFEENVTQQLKEMIRINRNHPSVVIWSIGNEFGYSNPDLMPKIKAFAARLREVVHAEDPTRPCGQGIGFGNWPQLNSATEVIGLNGGNNNRQFTVESASVSMQSEYGSGTSFRGGKGDRYDGCFDSSKINTEPPLPQVANGAPVQFSWRPGVSIWCAYDHGSNYGMGHMGFVDHARIPKKRYYFYRELYAGVPPPVWPAEGTPAKLSLTADQTVITDDGRCDAYLQVQVQDKDGKWLANSPAITLTDKSGLGLFPTGKSITFTPGATEKGVIEGLAAIEYRSYRPGKAVIEASAPGLPPTTITLTVKHAE